MKKKHFVYFAKFLSSVLVNFWEKKNNLIILPNFVVNILNFTLKKKLKETTKKNILSKKNILGILQNF